MSNERTLLISIRKHEARLRKLEAAADLPVGNDVDLPEVRAKMAPFRPLTEDEKKAEITALVLEILAQQKALGVQPTVVPPLKGAKSEAGQSTIVEK